MPCDQQLKADKQEVRRSRDSTLTSSYIYARSVFAALASFATDDYIYTY
jgi:hypothetical protein